MKITDAVRRSTVAVEAGRSIVETAKVMEASTVGAVVVLDEAHRVVGIVTDRDIVRRAVASGVPLDGRIDSIMSTPVVTVDAAADLHSVCPLFRTHAVRRLPVVDSDRFIGMVTVDDLLMDLSADLADVVRPIAGETLFGHRDAAVPATI